jgi:hypothetical protein
MVHKLYSALIGATSLEIRNAGQILGLFVSIANTGAGVHNWEVSFLSSGNYLVNDTSGVLAAGFLGAGQSANVFIQTNEPIEQGERLFLHTTTTAATDIFVFTDALTTKPAVRRR